MSDDEDDYLSDKWLASLTAPASKKPTAPQTYAERRKDAAKRAERLQAENRMKSRREREAEAREEALSRTLFERAEEEDAGAGGNKALAMMMRMGFKPGQALGQKEEKAAEPEVLGAAELGDDQAPAEGSRERTGHLVEPLPLNEWTGKKGIGLGKRALSPSAIENLAKAAKHADTEDIDTYRNRTREGYVERRAEGRLRSAQRTCAAQDAEAGITFNVFWLNPEVLDTFPRSLLDAMEDDAYVLAPLAVRQRALDDIQARTRLEMQGNALQPIQALDSVDSDDGAPGPKPSHAQLEPEYDDETVSRASEFLRLSAPERLAKVLSYLRDKYHYCFWCGTQYASGDELETSCPGEDEEDHD